MDIVILFLIAAFASGNNTCEINLDDNVHCSSPGEDELTLERFFLTLLLLVKHQYYLWV